MALIVSGFNGFGQFGVKTKRKILKFEDVILDNIISDDDNNVLISCTWSYLCVAKGNVLHLRGFLSDQPDLSTSLTTEHPIKALATNDRFCLVLLENGKLYKLTPSLDSQLEEIILLADHSTLPQKRSIFGEPKLTGLLEIAFVACGNNITVAISSTNIVFSGTTQTYRFPQHVHIKTLQCGFEHAVILTRNGDIYSWGNGLRAQLGQEILRREETPTLVEALAGIKVVAIAAGGWHTVAISAFGDLYTWGYNTNGQLGLKVYKTKSCDIKEPSIYPLPQMIDLPACDCTKNSRALGEGEEFEEENCTPIEVMAGARHTLVLNKCGALYGCGWNGHGQLGLQNNADFCDNFQYILNAENASTVRKIFCGHWCTIIKK